MDWIWDTFVLEFVRPRLAGYGGSTHDATRTDEHTAAVDLPPMSPASNPIHWASSQDDGHHQDSDAGTHPTTAAQAASTAQAAPAPARARFEVEAEAAAPPTVAPVVATEQRPSGANLGATSASWAPRHYWCSRHVRHGTGMQRGLR